MSPSDAPAPAPTSERPPARIRAYGLFPFTRRWYVILQTCCFTAILIALVWLSVAPPDVEAYRKLAAQAPPADRLPIELFAKGLKHARAILLAIGVIGAIETVWMLRKFRAAETRGPQASKRED